MPLLNGVWEAVPAVRCCGKDGQDKSNGPLKSELLVHLLSSETQDVNNYERLGMEPS